jgi:hypothetical protein
LRPRRQKTTAGDISAVRSGDFANDWRRFTGSPGSLDLQREDKKMENRAVTRAYDEIAK